MTEQERRILISLRLQNAKETLAEIPVHIEHGFWDSRQSGDYNAFIMMDEDKVIELYPRAVFFIETIEQLIISGNTPSDSDIL